MILSVGDKVRVHYYPPGNTESFVEGTVERSEVKTFDGPGFSLRVTREVILGTEARTHRSLPYIVRYEREDDFEGRITLLEAAVEQPEARIEAEAIEAEPVTEEMTASEAEPEAAPVTGEVGAEPEVAEVPEPQSKVDTQLGSETRRWFQLLRRAA